MNRPYMTFVAKSCRGLLTTLRCDPDYPSFLTNNRESLFHNTSANFSAGYGELSAATVNMWQIDTDICNTSTSFFFEGATNCATRVINQLNQFCPQLTSFVNCPSFGEESERSLIIIFSIAAVLAVMVAGYYGWKNRNCCPRLFTSLSRRQPSVAEAVGENPAVSSSRRSRSSLPSEVFSLRDPIKPWPRASS